METIACTDTASTTTAAVMLQIEAHIMCPYKRNQCGLALNMTLTSEETDPAAIFCPRDGRTDAEDVIRASASAAAAAAGDTGSLQQRGAVCH